MMSCTAYGNFSQLKDESDAARHRQFTGSVIDPVSFVASKCLEVTAYESKTDSFSLLKGG
jgi:hypothetical protein